MYANDAWRVNHSQNDLSIDGEGSSLGRDGQKVRNPNQTHTYTQHQAHVWWNIQLMRFRLETI